MMTLKYDTLRELARQLFPGDPNCEFSVVGMAHAYETKCFPPTCRRTVADRIIQGIGHTVRYIGQKECQRQERFKIEDEKLESDRMMLCFLPSKADENDTSDCGRVYLLREADVYFYKALEVPGLS